MSSFLFSQLPDEILPFIFDYCSSTDKLKRLQLVSRRFQRAVYSKNSWTQIVDIDLAENPFEMVGLPVAPRHKTPFNHLLIPLTRLEYIIDNQRHNQNQKRSDLVNYFCELLCLFRSVRRLSICTSTQSTIEILKHLVPVLGERHLDSVHIYASSKLLIPLLPLLAKTNQSRSSTDRAPVRLLRLDFVLYNERDEKMDLSMSVKFLADVLGTGCLLDDLELNDDRFDWDSLTDQEQLELPNLVAAFDDARVEYIRMNQDLLFASPKLTDQRTLIGSQIINRLRPGQLKSLKLGGVDFHLSDQHLLKRFLCELEAPKVAAVTRFAVSIVQEIQSFSDLSKSIMDMVPNLTHLMISTAENYECVVHIGDMTELVYLVTKRMQRLRKNCEIEIRTHRKSEESFLAELKLWLDNKFAGSTDLVCEKRTRKYQSSFLRVNDQKSKLFCDFLINCWPEL